MLTFGPFETTHEAVNAAITLLRAEGFTVSIDREGWETVGELRERLGFASASHFTQLLKHPECPHYRALTGIKKILKLRSNAALEQWLLARKP